MTFKIDKNTLMHSRKSNFVSWEDALKDLGERDPEALDNFFSFHQKEDSPFAIYKKMCSIDLDVNGLFLDSLLVSVQKRIDRDTESIEIEEDGFHLC